MESQSCPACVPVGLLGLWTAITPRPDLGSGRGLNQYCSPRWDLSNDLSHSPSARREQVDSWLLMVGSQTASLTPGLSFAHNLGCRCPNDQCEGHFRYLHFKTFPMTPRTPQCEVFWALLSNSKHSGVPEDSKSPTLGVLGFTLTLGQSGVATVVVIHWNFFGELVGSKWTLPNLLSLWGWS
jgi:hypothetical protein